MTPTLPLSAPPLQAPGTIQPQPMDQFGDMKAIGEFLQRLQSQGQSYGAQIGQQVQQNREAGVPYPGAFSFARDALVWLEKNGLEASERNVKAVMDRLQQLDRQWSAPSAAPLSVPLDDNAIGRNIPIPPEAQAPAMQMRNRRGY